MFDLKSETARFNSTARISPLFFSPWQRSPLTHHAVIPCYPHEMDVFLRGEPVMMGDTDRKNTQMPRYFTVEEEDETYVQHDELLSTRARPSFFRGWGRSQATYIPTHRKKSNNYCVLCMWLIIYEKKQ